MKRNWKDRKQAAGGSLRNAVLVKSAEVDSTRHRDFSIDSLDIWIALISLWSKDRINPIELSFKEIDLISIFFKVNKNIEFICN